MKNKFIYLTLLAAGFAACEPEFENELNNGSYSAGDADFSSYVAIGNSLTAGVMDGTVSRGSQAYSFPNLLSQQFALVGGGEFTQPPFDADVDNLGGLLFAGNQIGNTRLIIDAGAGGPEPIAGMPSIEVTQQFAMAYNNMGVPQAKSFHLLAPGYGNIEGVPLGLANPYFARHATSATTTVIDDAMMKNPTFFTNWIGNNDVLGYATGGGAGAAEGLGSGDITPITVFESSYNEITNRLTANGAKGVVATIPNVTAIPFFTTVPYNPLTPTLLGGGNPAAGAAVIEELNVLYGQLAGALAFFGEPGRISLLSTTGSSPLLIKDETLTDMTPQLTVALMNAGYPEAQAQFIASIYGQARQATSSDLILLTTRAVIGTSPAGIPEPFNSMGITFPLQDQHVLIPSEISIVNTATADFNSIIKSVAEAKGLAVADMNAIMNQLVSGLRVEDGQIYTADYFSTSSLNTVMFSLDGIHPNARGYALIANEVIKLINSHYNAKLPLLSAGNFPGATVLPSNDD